MKLPELGENIEGGDVLRVMVKAGDTIKKDQAVLELETDKATIEVPSSAAGVVKEIKVKPGEKVKVGQTIFVVDEKGAQAQPAKADGEAGRAAARRRRSQSNSRSACRAEAGSSSRSRAKRREAKSRSRRDEAGQAGRSGSPRRRRLRRMPMPRRFLPRLPRAGSRASSASTSRTFRARVPAAAFRWTMSPRMRGVC